MSQPVFVKWVKTFPVTTLITAFNVGMYFITCSKGASWVTPEFDVLVEMGASRRDKVWEGEYWRFFSAMALHGNLIHILCNGYFMLGLCSSVEKIIGPVRFVLFYLLSGVGATAVSLLGHDAVSVGASGAAFGMIGILFSFYYRRVGSLSAFFADPMIRRTLGFIAMFTVLGFFANFDNFAHFGGMGFGILLGLTVTASMRRPLRTVAYAGVVLAVAGAAVAAAYPWMGQSTQFAVDIAAEGEKKLNAGNPEKAVELLNQAEEFGFIEWQLYFVRGRAFVVLGRFEEAIRDLERALRDEKLEAEGRAEIESLLLEARAGGRSVPEGKAPPKSP